MIVTKAAHRSTISPDTLVSIGVPAFNRPHSLARTLQNLLAQTWPNIEIILSDNCSTDPAVADVSREFCKKDSRIRYFRQQNNIGAAKNFFFVANQSYAPFFMWAADDDYIAPWFVERCMEFMLDREDTILCTTETQYMSAEGVAMELVPQGTAFRRPTGFDRLGRMDHMLRNNFDNLVYGLFRRDALIQNGEIYWSRTTSISLNEIPPLLAAAFHGEIVVFPEVGIFKTATQDVYAQAAWEERGGRLPPKSRMTSLRSMISTWRYHAAVIRAIEFGLEKLDIPAEAKHHLIALSRSRIHRHFLCMLAQYKPRRARVSEIKR